jgi:hypothetical protein
MLDNYQSASLVSICRYAPESWDEICYKRDEKRNASNSALVPEDSPRVQLSCTPHTTGGCIAEDLLHLVCWQLLLLHRSQRSNLRAASPIMTSVWC